MSIILKSNNKIRLFSIMLIINLLISGIIPTSAFAEDVVTVTQAYDIKLVTSIGLPPELPDTVNVSYSDGSSGELDVSWESINPDNYFNAKNFTVNGTVDNTSLAVKAKVYVGKSTIVAIDTVNVFTVKGSAPKLPKNVTALYSDGSTKQVDVTWDTLDTDSYADINQIELSGSVDGTDINAIADINVIEPTDQYVATIYNADATTYGTDAPQLPDTVNVEYNDGTTGSLKVKWSDANAEDFAFHGIAVLNGTTYAGNYPVQVNVHFLDKVITTIIPVKVTTNVNKQPALPEKVDIIYNSGKKASVTVNWDTVAKTKYKNAGSFTVKGTIEGTVLKAVAKVKVVGKKK